MSPEHILKSSVTDTKKRKNTMPKVQTRARGKNFQNIVSKILKNIFGEAVWLTI